MHISESQIQELEFQEIRTLLGTYALSEVANQRLENLLPIPEKFLVVELKKVKEFLLSFDGLHPIPLRTYPILGDVIKNVSIEGYTLELSSIVGIRGMVEVIKDLHTFFKKNGEVFPALARENAKVEYQDEILSLINGIIDKDGEIKNKATPELESIREAIKLNKKQIQTGFSRVLGALTGTEFLDEIRESIVDDERVLAVKSAYKKKVPGRIMGESKSGSITFILPEAILPFYTHYRENKEEEKKEIHKILRHLSSELSFFAADFKIYQAYCIRLDIVHAKARLGQDVNGIIPKLNKNKVVKLINAYHPLLLLKNKAKELPIYSQSIQLNPGKRIICISGPNAGGKSITLKTVGLLQIMLQCAIPVPLDEGSSMCLFANVMTDIGDNQSIDNHVSTYSARLKKMQNIIEKADGNTLLLIDEFGTGSDPELGGALAESFLEYFYEKGCYGIITTHYTNIKIKVEELPEAENAAMLFNEKTLEPLYKLEIGRAGSSFTFEVAEKNHIPQDLIQKARNKIKNDVLNLDKTLVKLQQDAFELDKMRSELDTHTSSTINTKENIERLNKQLEEKLYNFQKLYEEEHRKLQFGNKIEKFVEASLAGKSRKDIVRDFIKLLEVEKHRVQGNNRDEGKRMQIIRRKITQQLKRSSTQEKITETIAQKTQEVKQSRQLWLKIGQRVRIAGSTSVGTIESVDKNGKVLVNYGKFTTRISEDQLERI